jgi:hypothetical protein
VLKEMAASQAAKALALCVCPVVGAAAVTLAVPEIRHAVHNATAPNAGTPNKRARLATREPAACPDGTPIVMAGAPIGPIDIKEPDGLTILPDFNDPYPAVHAVQASLPSEGGFVRPEGSSGGGSSGGIPAPVPEPATWLQAVVGFGVAGSAIRMATRKRADTVVADILADAAKGR